MRRLSDRFCEAARSCESLSDLRSLLGDTCSALGFRYFALLHHASLGDPHGSYIRIDNYPAEWVEEFVARRLYRDDPVQIVSRRSGWAFAWRDLARLTSLGRRGQWILSRGAYFGLGEGVTIPINVPGEPAGSCSFAVPAGAELPADRARCAELVGAHAFAAARRLSPVSPVPPPPRLSPRELECLRLVAAGKSDFEIGAILGIATETARQYVKRARDAYDVTTRTQLAVHGLRDDLIRFDEALDARIRPPGGSG